MTVRNIPTKRFPLLRYPLFNPMINPVVWAERLQGHFKGKSIEDILRDNNPLFAPFFLYSEHVVDEIYRLWKTPSKENIDLLKKLFNRIVPVKSKKRKPYYYSGMLQTTIRNCRISLEIFDPEHPPWAKNFRRNLLIQYKKWGKDIEGRNKKPISWNTFSQIYYDAKKEFEWFVNVEILKASTREEKWRDFLKMLKEYVDYHENGDISPKPRSMAVDIFYDAVKRKKTGHK